MIEKYTETLTSILSWLTSALGDVQAVFYTAGEGLTFLGVTSVIGVGIGISLLVVNKVQDFLKLR